jgi:hypothetical protein
MGSIFQATTQQTWLAIDQMQVLSAMKSVLPCVSSWPERHYSDVGTAIVVLRASQMATKSVHEAVSTPWC